jgi:hypothetical protein
MRMIMYSGSNIGRRGPLSEEFRERLGKFGLELQPDKTRRIEFGRFAAQDRKQRGEGKPETFDFLGFTHLRGKDRNGNFAVKRHTIGKRMGGSWQKSRSNFVSACTNRWLKPASGSNRWCKATSTITRYRATPIASAYSAGG